MKHFELPALGLHENLDCDICIIGTGPAGAVIAQELSGSALRVSLLESGGFQRQASADELDEIESVGWPRIMDQWLVRNRIVGGSSHTWSGRCVPFDPIDFEPRAWVPQSGWPLSLAALTPYLERAAPYLGMSLGTGFTDERFWTLAGRKRPMAPFDEENLRSYFWQFSRDEDRAAEHTRFGRHLAKKLGDNVTLITNATVCQVLTNSAAGAATGVEIAAPDGTRRRLAAPLVVLCAGGIENPRLLLCSNQVMPQGLGNQHDLVGRFLMDHIRGPVASLAIAGSETLQKWLGHYRIKGGQVFAHGMQLSPALQRRERLLNCAAWLEGRITEDDPWNALKRLLKARPELTRDIASIARNAGLLARGLKDYFIERNGLPRKIERLMLICMCEQIPDRDSRVLLSERGDRFGMPRARIDWRVHEIEERTVWRMTELVVAEFARLGLPAPRPDPWVRDHAAFPKEFQDVAHPTGTTRMAREPEHGVVDPDCQVHGVSGLYVAGSSVFPTSSHANPTQMIVALALRLADTIKSRASLGN